MSRTFMIMAAATGVEDFGSGITRAMRALAFAEMPAAVMVRESCE